MARQTGNDAVTRRARKFLEANPESPNTDMMESKFKMSTKNVHKKPNEIRKIFKPIHRKDERNEK